MLLTTLLQNIEIKNIIGTKPELQHITQLTLNSKEASPNTLFAALNGTTNNGHNFIENAIQNGANAILCEQIPEPYRHPHPTPPITFITVKNSHIALAQLAANFYEHPSKNITLVGITGTNGKTTTATLLYQLFKQLGYKVGLISTIQHYIHNQHIDSTHTTPNPIIINYLLQEMCKQGCQYAFMEVSSHAIEQHRTTALHFTAGIFTNLTHDHLDYHLTFDNYLKAKKTFFDQLPTTAYAITNADDKNGLVMIQNTKAKKITYALKSPANIKAHIMENNLTGLVLNIEQTETHCRLIGEFNAYNLLAIYTTATQALHQKPEQVLPILSNLQAAEGRFDYIKTTHQKVTAIVDYAHTPDALKNVLQTIDQVKKNTQKLIAIVGCGGNRDTTKRPIMAKVAFQYTDTLILTSDNPRNENPDTIIQQMLHGLDPTQQAQTLCITNRTEAIKTACTLAQPNDIILIAGKGHEKYQEINNIKHPFDDKLIAKQFLELFEK